MASVHGLDTVVAAATELSMVDGEAGRLVYRGYPAPELALHRSFAEVAHLLWAGDLPDATQLLQMEESLKVARVIPHDLQALVDALPQGIDVMSGVRTVVSAVVPCQEWPPTLADATLLTGMFPTIVASVYAKSIGQTLPALHHGLSHVENYLYMLSGEVPSAAHARALEAYLILTMDHGLNASTFASRITLSTQSDMSAGLTAALGAMKGPLHGGAPSGVIDMLDKIQTRENAEPWLRAKLDRSERLMGFGHRVYKTVDPRAEALKAVVRDLAGADPWFDLAVHVERTAVALLEEYKPGHRLYTNVEFWAAAILRTVGIPKDLYTATFSTSRVVGWTAHMLEQAQNNRLIRPQSQYVGPMPSSGAGGAGGAGARGSSSGAAAM